MRMCTGWFVRRTYVIVNALVCIAVHIAAINRRTRCRQCIVTREL